MGEKPPGNTLLGRAERDMGGWRPLSAFRPDPDAAYVKELTIDLNTLKPTVAMPHLPSNTRTVDLVAGTHIDQVIIGSCTNTDVLLGGCATDAVGKSYPEGTAEKCKACDAVLLGAVGGPKWGAERPAEQRPETALLAIRKDLGLYATCVLLCCGPLWQRPVR